MSIATSATSSLLSSTSSFSPDNAQHSAVAFSVGVYCGSRAGTLPVYAETARQVGQWIGQHGGQLVYGGGHNGLMGLVADATLQAGGRVVGVIPQALVDREVAF